MMTESKVDKFIASTAMGTPFTEDAFFDSPGTSEFIRFYSSNTYRTITERPEKKSELSINQKMTTITWDFFKNNGDFIAQLITFISIDSHDPLTKGFLENFKTKIDGLMEYILILYISKKNDDIHKIFAENINFLLSEQNTSISISCIFTMLRPELIESQLPKDCDVFLENNQFSFEDLRSQAKKCYVITTDNKLKLVIRPNKGLISTQEIKCPRIKELKNALLTLNLPTEEGFFPGNKRQQVLQNILKFVPAEDKSKIIKSQKGESAYSTLVLTNGKHHITFKESTGPGSWITKPISLATIQHYQKDDIIQIGSRDGLLLEEKKITLVDEKSIEEFKKDEKYFVRLYPTHLKSKLLAKAEEERIRIYQSWTQSTTKLWLSVISRLLVFQNRLQNPNFKPELQPEDPIYQRLREASLESFWSFTKALEMTEIDESDVIPEKGLEEIKTLWAGESKEQKLGWFEAFKKRYPDVPLHNGEEIGVVTVMPHNHICKTRSFSALPISTDVTKLLKTFNYQLSRGQDSVIFCKVPSILTAQLTLDTIREFHYMRGGKFHAKLTVLFSPRYTEEEGWQQHMKNTCDLVLSSLAKKIFDYLHLFTAETEGDLRPFIASVLSQSPYNEVKASLLLCMTVPYFSGTKRYLIGIGNCLALTFKDEQCQAVIGARYAATGGPVLLNSLNKPDNPKALIPSSSVRKRESVQVVVITDSKKDVFLISGRAIAPGFLKQNPEFKSQLNFREYDLNIDALLRDTEVKDQKMVDYVLKALQNNRRKFLDLIENPLMISAWKKIEDLLRGQQFKSVKEKLENLKKPESNQEPMDGDGEDEEVEDSQLSNFYSAADLVNKCDTAFDFIEELKDFSKQYYMMANEDQRLLTKDESSMVQSLWSMAVIEAQGFPDSKETEPVQLTWPQVRGKYFPYFQGVKDLIAIANPSSSIGCHVGLFQHINALAEQAFYPLQSAGKKQEALEVQTFKQIICAIGNDNNKIYHVLYQKLKFFDSNNFLGFDLSGFWGDLMTLLVATKLIRDPDYSERVNIVSEDYYVREVIFSLSKMLGLNRGRGITNFGAITLLPPPVKTRDDNSRKILENTNETKHEF